jgi:hypothetical protein
MHRYWLVILLLGCQSPNPQITKDLSDLAAPGGQDGGAVKDGAATDGATSDSATSDGATSDGATSDGATSDGATSDGATSDGATSDGATSDGDSCVAESDDHFCARLAKDCGAVSASDNCGLPRMAQCGSCSVTGQTCGGAGVANVCGGPTLAGNALLRAGAASFSVANDGAHAAVYTTDPSSFESSLNVVNLSGAPSPTPLANNVLTFAFSDSGAHLVYTVDTTPNDTSSVTAAAQAWDLPFASGVSRLVGNNVDEYDLPLFSADESRLFVIDGRGSYQGPGNLRSIVSSTGTSSLIAGAAGDMIRSPDRSLLLYSTSVTGFSPRVGNLNVLGLPSGSPTLIASNVATSIGAVFDCVALAGGQIFYLTGVSSYGATGSLFSSPVTGGFATPIATSVSPHWNSAGCFQVADDGGHLAYFTNYNNTSFTADAWLVAASGGTPLQLGSGISIFGYWSFKADHLLFTTGGIGGSDQGNLMLSKYDGFSPSQVDAAVDSPQFAPDGRTATYRIGNTRYLYSPITSGKAVLTSNTQV